MKKTRLPVKLIIDETKRNSKMKVLIAKTTLAMSLMTTGLHYIGHSVVAVEASASDYIASQYANTIAGLAQDMGFIRPVKLEPMTRNKIIMREILVNEISPVYAGIYAGVHVAESSGNQNAVSEVGARGLGQVMPANAEYCGFSPDDLFDEEKNIICGVRLFAEALKNQKFNLINALKEYHAGADRKKWGPKTEAYPNLVLTALAKVK